MVGTASTDAREVDLTRLLLRAEVQDFLTHYQRVVDELRHEEWYRLFTSDGTYTVIDAFNERDQGMTLVNDVGGEALKERWGYLDGYWKTPRSRTLHLVSNVQLTRSDGDDLESLSKFLVYRTDRYGVTAFHACGTYHDQLVRSTDGLRIRCHRVVIENNVLPDDFTALL